MSPDFSPLQGKFVTFEGIEGVGKTTNLAFVADHLRSAGVDLVVTREPGGTEVGEEIRQILLRHRTNLGKIAADTEMLLLFASRAQHIQEVIQPALAANKCVLCDRFIDATYAYQGGGRGIARNRIHELEKLVQGDLQPDVTLLFDAPVNVGLERARGRAGADRIEQETVAFFEGVRTEYLARARAAPERYKIIDAVPALATVQQHLATVLSQLNTVLV